MIWAGRITEAAARLERLGLGHVDAEALATALIDDAAGWVHLKAAGHLLALVSNTEWRSAARYREDFAGWQADDCFDAYVTSLDVGFRKPHAGMFQRALELLGAAPGTL